MQKQRIFAENNAARQEFFGSQCVIVGMCGPSPYKNCPPGGSGQFDGGFGVNGLA